MENKINFRYITLEELSNGLQISLNAAGIELVKELKEDGKSEFDIWYELFEDVHGNSEYVFHNDMGESGFGMTNAEGITDGYFISDKGDGYDTNYPESAKVYWFPNYMVISSLDKMFEEGKVFFNKADDEKMEKGGGVNTGRSWHLDRQKRNKSESWEKPMSKRKQRYDVGGGVGLSFRDDTNSWFDDVAEKSKELENDKRIIDAIEIANKEATRENLEKFRISVKKIPYSDSILKNIDGNISKILSGSYKKEFRFMFGGKRRMSGKSSAAKEFFNIFTQAATYDWEKSLYANGGGVKATNQMKFVVKDRATQKQFENHLEELSNKYFNDYADQLEEEGYDLDNLFNISIFQDVNEYVTSFSVPFDDDINFKINESIEQKFGDLVKNVPYYYANGGGIDKRDSWHSDRRQFNKSESWEKPMSKRKQRYANGGGVKAISEFKKKYGFKIGDKVKFARNGVFGWEEIDEAKHSGYDMGNNTFEVTEVDYTKGEEAIKLDFNEQWIHPKHFDLADKFGNGGGVDKRDSWHSDRRQFNKNESWEKPMSKRKQRYDVGGGVMETETVFLEHPLLIERHNDGMLEFDFDSNRSTGWSYSTQDVGEAVAIMIGSKFKTNEEIREIKITPKQLKLSNPSDIIYWLSGGNRAWRFGEADYKYDFNKTYNDLWKKEGLKIKKAINQFTTVGELIDFYKKEYLDYPYFYSDAMDNGYTEDNDEYSKGGGINSGRDLLFKSQEPHEQAYKRKREFKKYGTNGSWFSDFFKDGGLFVAPHVQDLHNYIISAYGFLLPLEGEEGYNTFTYSDFAEELKSNYDIKNPRNKQVYDYLIHLGNVPMFSGNVSDMKKIEERMSTANIKFENGGGVNDKITSKAKREIDFLTKKGYNIDAYSTSNRDAIFGGEKIEDFIIATQGSIGKGKDAKFAIAYWYRDDEDGELQISRGLLNEISDLFKGSPVVLYTNAGVDLHSITEGKRKNIQVVKVAYGEFSGNSDEYAKGGTVESLEKELRKLQRDLNSHRLSTYMEGDESEERKALNKEREVKLARFNEVLDLLRDNESKLANGGTINKKKIKGDIGKITGKQYGYTLENFEKAQESIFVSPNDYWKKQEGSDYKDFIGRKQLITDRDKDRLMESYAYKIMIAIDLGSKKVPLSAKKYAESIYELKSNEIAAKYSKGGGINSGRDLLFKSQEPHEQAYKRKREFKKYGDNGSWFNDFFKEGGKTKNSITAYLGEVISTNTAEMALGRKINSWKDEVITIDGISYRKVYLKPEYKQI